MSALRSTLLTAAVFTALLASPATADEPRRVEEPTPGVDEKRQVVVVRPKSRVVVRAGDPAERANEAARAVAWRSTYLGVEATPLTPELRRHFGVDEDRGVLLGRVVEDSPAQRAGLRVGDVVTAVDGVAVARQHELGREIRRHDDGASVAIDYVRDGRPARTHATLEQREVRHALGTDFDFDYDYDLDIDLDLPELQRLGERLQGLEIEIDPAALEAIGERLEELMESEEWQLQMKALEDIDLHELEERLEQLHLRMETLGVELEQRGQILERRGERARDRSRNDPV